MIGLPRLVSSSLAVPVLRPKVHRQGPNKRQKLSQAVAVPVPELGHTWTITSSAKNLCAKCQVCSLFAQQTDPAPLVDFVLSHPCKGFKATPAANCNIHPSHSIVCSSSVRVPAKGRLCKTCGAGARPNQVGFLKIRRSQFCLSNRALRRCLEPLHLLAFYLSRQPKSFRLEFLSRARQ